MELRVFDNLKVADFTWAVAGPIISKYLADFGAKVVHVESKSQPDTLRTSLPFKDEKQDLEHSGYFPLYNSNKYGMALNLKNPKSIDIAKRLAAWCDVFIESYRPGAIERLGLGYENLKQVNPDIIMLSTSMQGQTGPHALLPGFGNQLVGLAGFSYITGWPDRDVVQPYGAYTDCIAPYYALIAIIGAILSRNKTGKGQFLDLSQYEAGVHFMSSALLDYEINGREANREGNVCYYAAPHGVYRCKGEDNWCAIAVFNDEEWWALCQVMDKKEIAHDPRFATAVARKNNEHELDKLVAEWTLNLDREEVMTKLQAAGVPSGILNNNADLFVDPQLNHRHCYWMIEHPELGSFPHPSPTFNLSDSPAEPLLPSPCIGQHTEFVCKEYLKMQDEEYIQLLLDGVFE